MTRPHPSLPLGRGQRRGSHVARPLPYGEGQGRGSRWRGGFTIVEAVIGMLVLAMILGALASTFLVGYTIISKETEQISADTAVSDATLTLLRDLSSATGTFTNGPLMPGNGNVIAVAYGNPLAVITYQLDAQGNLIRMVNLANPRTAARSLQSVSLATAGCRFTVTLTPSALPVAQTLQVTRRTGGTGCF